MANDPLIPLSVAPVMREIERGMALAKCRKCGCMQDALDQAERAFLASEEAEVRALAPAVQAHKNRMEPLAYDCIGCKKCWGADATKLLAERFGDAVVDGSGGCGCGAGKDAPVVRLPDAEARPWPPYPGDYILGDPAGSVAVCTLSSRELAATVIGQGGPAVAIAGRCDTENIGVEKVVLNLLANTAIRWLILCGAEAPGHRAGDAFLHLKEKGVDANMRVLESAAWRPVLKNLTLSDVARFREQVEVVNLIGTSDPAAIAAAARECAGRPAAPLEAREASRLAFEHISARAPERLLLDPAGFFIVLPEPETGKIVCEHYENNGRLAHVIEGRQAAVIAATAVERGLVTRLDHAAYLGRELAKAEMALKSGVPYEQDAALGMLPTESNSSCAGAGCGCQQGNGEGPCP